MMEYEKGRAWVKDLRHMGTVTGINFTKQVASVEVPVYEFGEYGDRMGDFDTNFAFDELVLMRYTGFSDVWGNEVYEEDIVYDEYLGKYGLIVRNGFKWEIKWSNKTSDGLEVYEDDVVVVGNRYETPNLYIDNSDT